MKLIKPLKTQHVVLSFLSMKRCVLLASSLRLFNAGGALDEWHMTELTWRSLHLTALLLETKKKLYLIPTLDHNIQPHKLQTKTNKRLADQNKNCLTKLRFLTEHVSNKHYTILNSRLSYDCKLKKKIFVGFLYLLSKPEK